MSRLLRSSLSSDDRFGNLERDGAAPDAFLKQRPRIRHLLLQLWVHALLLGQMVNLLRPDWTLALPVWMLTAMSAIVMILLLGAATRRQIRSARLLYPELPVLQRVAMGDAEDEAQRQSEEAQTFNLSWTLLPKWWGLFALINLVLAMPWPTRFVPDAFTSDVRLSLLVAAHVAAALFIVHLWLRARNSVADA